MNDELCAGCSWHRALRQLCLRAGDGSVDKPLVWEDNSVYGERFDSLTYIIEADNLECSGNRKEGPFCQVQVSSSVSSSTGLAHAWAAGSRTRCCPSQRNLRRVQCSPVTPWSLLYSVHARTGYSLVNHLSGEDGQHSRHRRREQCCQPSRWGRISGMRSY